MFNLPPKILETQTLTAPAATVTFTGIAALVAAWDALAKVTSRHLVLLINAASPDAVAQRDVYLQFNADAGANYNYQTLEGENAVASAARLDAQNEIALFPIPGTTYADAFGGGEVMITHAFGAVNQAALLTLGGAVEDEIEVVDGRWTGIAAITSIVLAPSAGNFATGSEFHLAVVDERYCIEEILLAADGPVAFRNIPQREGDLVAVGYCRSDVAANADNIGHEINDDGVAANYFHQYLEGLGGGAPTAGTVNNSQVGICVGNNPGATIFSPFVASYSQPSKAANQPHILTLAGYHQDVGPTAAIRLFSARRANIEPITKLEYILLGGGTNFMAGSLFSLYHVPKWLIKRIELQVDTPTITFDAIPQDFEAIVLKIYARSDKPAASLDDAYIRLNDDAVAANYDLQRIYGQGAAVGATRVAAVQVLMGITGSTAGVNKYSGGIAILPGYTKTDRHKHVIVFDGLSNDYIFLRSIRWESLNAVVKLELYPFVGPNFKHGSVFELWGILPVEGLPAITVGG